VARDDNASGRRRETAAIACGALAVLGFSFSLPASRLAVRGLDPYLVSLGRATVAALIAALALALRDEPRPTRLQLRRLAVVAAGVVFGFPVLSTLALEHVGAAHAGVVAGLLPAATAVFAVLRAGERPSAGFWLACLGGLGAVIVFAAVQGAGAPREADVLTLAAVAAAGLGYAEGGALARELGGWRVIAWALVLALPLTAPLTLVAAAVSPPHAGAGAWLGFAYVSLVSMLGAFVVWYRGLALGGVARIGQIQLAQPVLTLAWASLVLGERIGIASVAASLAVLAFAALAQRTRVAQARGSTERARRSSRTSQAAPASTIQATASPSGSGASR
jgi:drug/metabolite transporter (DMT)-like permease